MSKSNSDFAALHQFVDTGQLAAKALSGLDSDIGQIVGQAQRIQSILRPVDTLHRQFVDLAEQIRSGTGPPNDLMLLANSAIGNSGTVVEETNSYFSAPPQSTPFEIPRDFPPATRDACEGIREGAEASELLLHDEAGDLIIVGGNALELVAKVVEERLEAKLEETVGPYAALLSRLQTLSQRPAFHELLKDFAVTIARDYWRTLWKTPGKEWLPRPERIAQGLLGTFLAGHWAGVAFVGREIAAGDGFIDIIVNFLGRDFIVEIKIVGGSWGIGHAKSGLDQLDAYMDSYAHPEAYLLVFDGRKTDTGEQLESTYELSHGTANVVMVATYSDAPSG